MLAAAFRVTSESSAGRSPYRFAQRPINCDSRVCKEPIHKIFTFDQYQLPVRQRRGRPRLHCRAHGPIPVQPAQPSLAIGRVPSTRPPHWCRERSSLFPRISRSQRLMAFLPDPTPGVPMPRYFSSARWLRSGRICTPSLSLSKSSRSPCRTPRIRRTWMGTVIWPLPVILACFCIKNSNSLLQHIFLTWGTLSVSGCLKRKNAERIAPSRMVLTPSLSSVGWGYTRP